MRPAAALAKVGPARMGLSVGMGRSPLSSLNGAACFFSDERVDRGAGDAGSASHLRNVLVGMMSGRRRPR